MAMVWASLDVRNLCTPTIQIIPAIYVKPFVKGQKNDNNDVEAIAEAELRLNLRVVQEKMVAAGSRRTATIKQIHTFLIG